MKERFKYFLNYVTSFFPAALPKGRTQFTGWASSIIELLAPELSEIPLDQKYYVLATMLINLKTQQDRYPRRYFVKQMNKAASNQVAAQIFHEIGEAEKQKKLTEQAALVSSKQAEVTAAPLAMAPRGQG